MRRLQTFGFVVLAIGVIGYFGYGSAAKPIGGGELPEQFRATWTVASYAVNGVADSRFQNHSLQWRRADAASISSVNQVWSSIALEGLDPSEPGKAFFLMENREDKEELGGGGPRKAIGRINPAGQLEIVAARCADFAFPEGFDAVTKGNSIVWTFNRSGD
jgi:hypothetical protein